MPHLAVQPQNKQHSYGWCSFSSFSPLNLLFHFFFLFALLCDALLMLARPHCMWAWALHWTWLNPFDCISFFFCPTLFLHAIPNLNHIEFSCDFRYSLSHRDEIIDATILICCFNFNGHKYERISYFSRIHLALRCEINDSFHNQFNFIYKSTSFNTFKWYGIHCESEYELIALWHQYGHQRVTHEMQPFSAYQLFALIAIFCNSSFRCGKFQLLCSL